MDIDPFLIPERMDPVARTENSGRHTSSSDQRRRHAVNPPRPPVESEDGESQDSPTQEEESHNLDELA